jgi:hypothetical protein
MSDVWMVLWLGSQWVSLLGEYSAPGREDVVASQGLWQSPRPPTSLWLELTRVGNSEGARDGALDGDTDGACGCALAGLHSPWCVQDIPESVAPWDWWRGPMQQGDESKHRLCQNEHIHTLVGMIVGATVGSVGPRVGANVGAPLGRVVGACHRESTSAGVAVSACSVTERQRDTDHSGCL